MKSADIKPSLRMLNLSASLLANPANQNTDKDTSDASAEKMLMNAQP